MTSSPNPGELYTTADGGGMPRQQSAMSHTPSSPPMSAQQSWAEVNSPEVVRAASGIAEPAAAVADDENSTRSCSPLQSQAVPQGSVAPDPAISPAAAASLLESWIEDCGPAAASGCHLLDTMTLRNLPPLGIGAFVDRVFTYGSCDPVCFVVALALVDRLRTASIGDHFHPLCTSGPEAAADSDTEQVASRTSTAVSGASDEAFAAGTPAGPARCVSSGQTGVRVSPYNVHRLFATAVVLAIKSTQDVYHPMGYYGAVFGVSAVDLRRMESALMSLLGHALYVSRAAVDEIVHTAMIHE